MQTLTTVQLADVLHVSYWRLMNLIRSRKIPTPTKDPCGNYLWGPENIEAARKILKCGDTANPRAIDDLPDLQQPQGGSRQQVKETRP